MKKFGYVMLVILCLGAHPARSADDFNFGFLPAINLGVWSDSGSLSATTDACIESWNGRSTRNYRFTVSDDIGGSGFYLYRDGNGSNSGSDRIAVTLLTKDSISSDVFGEITPDSPISPRAGQTQGCSAGDNASSGLISMPAIFVQQTAAAMKEDFPFKAREEMGIARMTLLN